MWPFKKKPDAPKPPKDNRDWNEDWQVGDTAECVIGMPGYPDWSPGAPPWEKMKAGARFKVIGFDEGGDRKGALEYWLKIEGAPRSQYSTRAFRKVRLITKEQSEIVERILTAKPGADNPREVEPARED